MGLQGSSCGVGQPFPSRFRTLETYRLALMPPQTLRAGAPPFTGAPPAKPHADVVLQSAQVLPIAAACCAKPNAAALPGTPMHACRLVARAALPCKLCWCCCRGHLHIDEPIRPAASGQLPDSYLALQDWGKGVAFVNGFNLGWYWPLLGPQETLYVPGAVLHPGRNEIILLEIEHAPQHRTGKGERRLANDP